MLRSQQSGWDPAAEEEARRRIEKQRTLEQQKQDPLDEEEARKRIEEQKRREEERNKNPRGTE